MYTPHTVTLYNVTENPDTLETDYNITILRGVFLDHSHARNIEKSGLRDADSATLFIPFSVQAEFPASIEQGNAIADVAVVDLAVTDKEVEIKNFVGPKEYRQLEDTSSFWTLEAGGVSSGVDCFFIKGEVVTKAGYRYIRENYDDVYDVTTVDCRDFGSKDMRHWQVGGK